MPILGVNHVVIVIVLLAVFCAYASVRLHGLLAVGLGFAGLNRTIRHPVDCHDKHVGESESEIKGDIARTQVASHCGVLGNSVGLLGYVISSFECIPTVMFTTMKLLIYPALCAVGR